MSPPWELVKCPGGAPVVEPRGQPQGHQPDPRHDRRAGASQGCGQHVRTPRKPRTIQTRVCCSSSTSPTATRTAPRTSGPTHHLRDADREPIAAPTPEREGRTTGHGRVLAEVQHLGRARGRRTVREVHQHQRHAAHGVDAKVAPARAGCDRPHSRPSLHALKPHTVGVGEVRECNVHICRDPRFQNMRQVAALRRPSPGLPSMARKTADVPSAWVVGEAWVNRADGAASRTKFVEHPSRTRLTLGP